ncbi:unnamed protein product, partial [Prorocentrum cordatum]
MVVTTIFPVTLRDRYRNRYEDFFRGFLDYVRKSINDDPERKYYFTGHSLGGGLAALVALEMSRVAVTFSSPGLEQVSKIVIRESRDQLRRPPERSWRRPLFLAWCWGQPLGCRVLRVFPARAPPPPLSGWRPWDSS